MLEDLRRLCNIVGGTMTLSDAPGGGLIVTLNMPLFAG